MTKREPFRLIEQATSASQIEEFSPIADASNPQILRPGSEPPQAPPSFPPTAMSGAQPAREPLDIYFGLEIIDETGNNVAVGESNLDIGPKTPGLELNKRYRVRVKVGTDRPGIALPYPLRHDVELMVGISAGGYDGIEMPVNRCPLPYDSADRFTRDFDLRLLPDCRRRSVTFTVLVIGDTGLSRPLAEQDVMLEGIPRPPAKPFKKAGLNPESRYPPTVGFLIFQEKNGKSISATCFNESSPTPEVKLLFAKPQFGKSAQFPKDAKELEEYVGQFLEYARRNDKVKVIREWLEALVGLHRDQLIIIIIDLTGDNLPWELLELDGLGQDQFLGALAPVVRRLPSQDWEYVDSHYQGTGLGYVDPELRRATQKRKALSDAGVNLFDSFDELKHRLLGPGIGDSALVFLDCHGSFTYTIRKLTHKRELALGTSLAGQRITVLDMENLLAHSGERALFVANACHSAKLIKDASGLYGLPEVLLDKCAGGYIGTFGPVDERPALDMCHHFTHEIHALPGGLHAASFLRRLRRKAANEYSAHRGHPDVNQFHLAFIYTFMYVYFGDPLARWSLQGQSDIGSQSGVAV